MPWDTIAEWAFRGVMVLTSVSMFFWNRSRKQAAQLAEAQEALRNQRLDEMARRSITEERLQKELADVKIKAAHEARNLILQDLQEHLGKVERKVDEARKRSSDTWSAVQTRIGSIELELARVTTRQEERK